MDDAARLAVLGTATLGESGARPMAPRMRPVWSGATVTAPAYTVRCAPADNLAVHLAVTLAPEGSVLVVDASHEPERGYWGEVLTTAAETRGLAGLVIDGCVRDTEALEAHGFPVFSAGVALRGAVKSAGGAVGIAVTVGDVEVDPGDWIVADRDGIAVVPLAQLTDVLAAGEARAAKEAGLFTALRAGQTTVELLGLDTSPVQQP
ncbi:MAG: RraA family protein [Actinomycetes bacterium]